MKQPRWRNPPVATVFLIILSSLIQLSYQQDLVPLPSDPSIKCGCSSCDPCYQTPSPPPPSPPPPVVLPPPPPPVPKPPSKPYCPPPPYVPSPKLPPPPPQPQICNACGDLTVAPPGTLYPMDPGFNPAAGARLSPRGLVGVLVGLVGVWWL